MSVLVIASTEMEIAPFIEKYPHASYLITGVGAASTIYKLTRKVQADKFNHVIQCGIAGCFSDAFELGESVLISRDAFADIGAFEKGNFNTVFSLGLSQPNEFPYENGLLNNPYLTSFQSKNRIANAITVNTIHDDISLINQLRNKFNADIESMEGAALHYVCMQEKISFLQIRGISNRAGERDKSKWKIKDAINSSNWSLMEIYESLQNNSK